MRQKKHNHGEHEHHHAFADPLENAKQWNAPERDQWQHPEEILAALALEPGASVADIGAGTGYMVAHLSKAVGDDGAVIAIDASEKMIEYLEGRREELGPAKLTCQKVGTDDPELELASVDGVLMLDTWHHIGDQQAYAMKVYDGLKRGGRFVIVDYEIDAETGPPREMRLTTQQVTKQLEDAGFRVDVASESMPRQYMIVGHKER
ncbi:MAG: methyltransferase type 11 [Planctomycetales bacterium 12-60-4]|nr:MAG: methyltransferase type 11 [Planctomycetales bacterium 12-60-4]